MVNYADGKIYKIICNTTGLCYIGSTCCTLAKRLKSHELVFKCFQKGKGNFITSFKVLENNNYIFELVELVACDNKIDLHKRERFHIENTVCVNKYIVGRTDAEYRAANTEHLKAYHQQYQAANRDTIKAKHQQYTAENIDKIREYQKAYRLKARTIKDLLKIAINAIVEI